MKQVLVVSTPEIQAAAQRLMPTVPCVTRGELETVAGRRVMVWTSLSSMGREAADSIAREAFEAGATAVKVLRPPDDAAPLGFALTDAERSGWSSAQCLAFGRQHAVEVQPGDVAMIATSQVSPARVPDVPAPPLRREGNVVKLPNAPEKLTPAEHQNDAEADWIMDDNCRPKPKLMHNFVVTIAQHHTLRGVFRKNLFTQTIEVSRRPPWDRSDDAWRNRMMTDTDTTMAQAHLEGIGLTPRTTDTDTAIRAAAEQAAFNHVEDYLTGLVWDGVPRVDTWLTEYLGVKPTASDIESVFGKRWLISGVARMMCRSSDGVKVDTVLILEGGQGKKKSTALEVLATFGGVRYFTDDIHDINSKDAVMQMQGCVIIEIAELGALSKAGVEDIKKWLSRRVDKIRLPYGRNVVSMPRRGVVAATHNPNGTGYLKDETGGRRFWPVYVAREIDLDRLRADRDQLWAEAVHLFRAGEQWWLKDDETERAKKVQAARYQEDVWAEDIDRAISGILFSGLQPLTIGEILTQMQVPVAQRNQVAMNRVAGHLKAHGYVGRNTKDGNRSVKVYQKEDV